MLFKTFSTLTLIVINEIVTLHFETYAAISARPAGGALATIFTVLQSAESVAAATVFASGYQESRTNTLIRTVTGRLKLIENRCTFRYGYLNGVHDVSGEGNLLGEGKTNVQRLGYTKEQLKSF